jgi:hypothetical protein
MTMEGQSIVAVIFAFVAAFGVVGGTANRLQLRKGIGTQFIRYTAVVVSLPVAASLAVLGLLTEAAVTVMMGALGYAFAGVAADRE